MLVGLIAACEVAFWVVLGTGLLLRYVAKRPRASVVALACTPLVDVVLLVAAIIDLQNGGTANSVHGLAAVYIGCSIGFGHRMIAWADGWAAYKLAGAPRPTKPVKGTDGYAAHQRSMWFRHLLAWAIGCGLLMAAVGLIGDGDRTQALSGMAGIWTIVLVIDLVVSFSYSFTSRASV